MDENLRPTVAPAEEQTRLWAAPAPGGPPPARADCPEPATWPAYDASYAWPPTGQPAGRTTNGLAVAALVTGILALVPVAVGLGIAALIQVRRRGQAGKGLAIGGLVAAGAWAAVFAGIVVFAGVFGDPVGGSLGRFADAGATTVGSCLLAPAGDDSVSVSADCESSHDAEVYRVVTLAGQAWPGYDRLDGSADDACFSGYQSYVGTSYDSSSYDYGYFLPDQSEWLRGEHRAVCAVVAGDQDTLRGSVRGTGR